MVNAARLLAKSLANRISLFSISVYSKPSFSQEGEDRVLDRYFGNRNDGFYVDVGAHHPHRFSNTYLFYKRGWRGINIDAMPGSMKPFKFMRPRDVNLEVGVGSDDSVAKFHVFSEPAFNTFDENLARQHEREGREIVREVEVPIRPLGEILSENVPDGKPITFMSIDVEGRDLDVLRSNDWQRYRPEVILVESITGDLDKIAGDASSQFLKTVGYRIYAKTVYTCFYVQASTAV
jgi:FkbM family methyltransferase